MRAGEGRGLTLGIVSRSEYSEAALAKRAERARQVEAFPGRLASWEAAVGKRVAAVAPVVGREERQAVAFEDGSFLLTGQAEATPEAIMAALDGLRPVLEAHHSDAYGALDQLRAEEGEAMRLARMEKVLGAVQTNLPQIPELRAALLRLLGVSDESE
jgi:hypothetical protein